MRNSKKYFTLISKEVVRQAPNAKVLSEEAYSATLSSQELIDRVYQEAQEYKKNVVLECEKIKEQAQKEGFDKGYSDWISVLARLEDEIAKVREEMQKLIMPISLKAAKKIVASELSVAPEIISEIVSNTLKSVSQHKRIVIYVNKGDLELLEKDKNKIKKVFESLESLSIRERDDIEQGGCIIETEGGIINARLNDRWRTIENAFESLALNLTKAKGEKPV